MRIKFKLISLIILISFLVSFSIAYSQGSLYSDPQGRFSLNLPAGWKVAVPYDSSQAAYFAYAVQQGNVGELIVMIEELPFAANVDQYAAAAEENGFKQLPGYQPGTQLPATVFGLPAIKKNFMFSPQAGVALQAEVYMLVIGNSAYTLLFDAITNYFVQLQPGFAQVVASFKVQAGAPAVVQPASTISQPSPVVPQVQPAPVPVIPTPVQPAPSPYTAVTPVTPSQSSPDICEVSPMPSAPVYPVQPALPTPPVSGSGMSIYTDTQGRFSIPIPAGSTTAQTTEIGVVLNTPDGAGIVAMYTLGEQYVQGMVAQIKPDHQFHGQSQLQAGNRQVLIELYSKVNPQDNINYATIVATYPGTPFMVLITVPADKYNQAQIWITEVIKGTFVR
jgi:hypothetical protein